MKVALKSLWDSGAALDRFAATEFATAKRGYQVGRIHAAVNGELEPIKKAYLKLLRKYGKEVKEGSEQFYIPNGSEAEELFNAELDALLAVEVEIWGDPISLDALEAEFKANDKDFKKLPLSARDIGALGWLLTE